VSSGEATWRFCSLCPFSRCRAENVIRIFEEVKREVKGGACASYIPALASADPSQFAVSICTVDGQQFSFGDTDATFSIQSCVKPMMYAVAVEDRGLSLVHRHVGFEPSGLAFNEVSDFCWTGFCCFEGAFSISLLRLYFTVVALSCAL
jgi:glutaminase